MTAPPVIRAATQDDLPELLALYALLHPNDPACPPDEAARIFDQIAAYPGSEILLAIRDGQIAASITQMIIPNLTRGGTPYALIENVITHPNHRRAGLGTTLLQEATGRAWSAGCYKVMLMTGSKDRAVLDFYAQAGFEQSKTGFQIRRPVEV